MLDYKKEYERWEKADLLDFDLRRELDLLSGKEEEIKEHFGVALEFGTAGIRGTLGVGTNRMNIFVVRQATEGLARYILEEGLEKLVAISYDSRLKGWTFAKEVAQVLAANGISVRLYDALMPVPALSFATRYYHCSAGIMLTASHNPAVYNGYKAYGSDGCQMTDEAADKVYAKIKETDVLSGAKTMSFSEAVDQGLIRFVEEECKEAFYQSVLSQSVHPGVCKDAGLSLVYTPLNGTGLEPVTRIFRSSAYPMLRLCRSRNIRMDTLPLVLIPIRRFSKRWKRDLLLRRRKMRICFLRQILMQTVWELPCERKMESMSLSAEMRWEYSS